MEEAIHKFPIGHIGEPTKIEMPRGAVVRHFAMQAASVMHAGVPTIWAQVRLRESTSVRSFVVLGTGHPIPENGVYIGTCQDGPYVWHLFELIAH